MKKLILSVAILATSLCANAQTLIKPNFKKGDVAHYENVTSMQIDLPMGAGSQQAKVTALSTITVKEANADGFVLEDLCTSIKPEGNEDLAENISAFIQYLENTPLLLQTNKDGEVIKIVNYNDVAAKISKGAVAKIDELYKKTPELEQQVPKAKLILALSTKYSEEKLIKTLKETGIYALYGKTLKTGDVAERNINGVKAKTTYTISPVLGTTAIVGTSKATMSEEDAKAYIANQIKEQGGDDDAMAQQVLSNWAQFKQMGMDKIDLDMTETAHINKSNWITDYATKGVIKVMGTNVEIESNTKLLDK